MKKAVKYIVMAFSGTLLISSCGGGKENAGASSSDSTIVSGDIKIDGSSTVYPITEAVAEDFKASFPDVKVTVGLSGTGGGFKKFGRGEIDINDASRSIKSTEDSLCKVNNIGHIEIKIAFDGLAVVVNPQNTWVNDITVAELKRIWEPEAQGKIKTWNQIRPEWPKEEIHLFGAGVESGTYDYFTEAIVGKSHSSRGDYTASEDDNVLVQGISTDKLALGFFGIAYFEANKDKLKVIPVDDQKDDNGKGPILPTIETVKNKTYSPLGRPLFIYVNSTAARRKEVQTFVDFYLKNGGALSQEVGYIAMTDEEYKVEKLKFDEFVKSLAK
jgi:phosphate transport system substrate-binding protein